MDDQDAMNNSISLLDEVYGYSAKNGDCNSESQERISEVNFNVNSTVKDSVKSENANMLNIEQAGEKSIIIDEQNASKSSANMHEEIFTSELLSEKNSSLINGIISTNCPLTEIANFAESAIPQCSKEGNKEGNRDKMKYKREQILYDEIINIEELTDEGSIVTNDSNLLEDRDTSFTGNEDRENLGLDVACLRKNEEISSTENSRESSEDVVEKYFSIIQKIESCSEGLQSDVIEPLTEESEKLNSLEKPTREKTEDSDLKSEEWIGNSKRKKEMNLKDDSGSSNQDEDGSKKTDPEDDSNINGYGVNILQMPEMVLEDIFKNLSLDDICSSVRPTCRTFYHASARVLRLVFRNIMPKLDTSIKCLEDMPFGNQWSRICTGYLTYKLLQSELLTLRAACARQVESGLWCFIPGKTLEEYMRLINGILDERTTGILDGISDILVNINKHAIEYFDSLYQAPFTLRDMKLFGVEIIEILSTAMNVSANMTVTYSAGGNSCFIAGKFGITHCTELKSPPLKRNTLEAHRKATLMYLRYLVRANNCDIVLRKLREWNKVVKNGSNLPCPYLGCPQWELKDRFNVVGDYIHEIYAIEKMYGTRS